MCKVLNFEIYSKIYNNFTIRFDCTLGLSNYLMTEGSKEAKQIWNNDEMNE